MWIVLITFFTTSTARTTNSFINIDNSNYRSLLPVVDMSFTFKNGNVHQSLPMYSYPIEYDKVLKLSDIVFQSYESNVRRRMGSQFKPQYPYTNSVEGTRRPVTEATTFSNTLSSHRNEENVWNYVKDLTTQKPQPIEQEINNDTKYNRTVNNLVHNDTRLDDVAIKHNQQNHTSHRNTTYKTIPMLNSSETLNINYSTDQSLTNGFHKNVEDKDNDKFIFIGAENNANNRNKTSVNKKDKDTYETKTSEENEVKNTFGLTSDMSTEKWIWTDADVEKTTTLMTLDDRAAFTGNNCPMGTVRIQNKCIPID